MINENEIRERIERWKINAESFIKTDTRAFIIDTNNTYFFCDIIFSGEDYIYFKPFKGNNCGIKTRKFWGDIIKFEEYKDK